MLKIKLTWPFNWPVIKQTPNRSGIWKNCQFFINEEIKDCDFWVVFDTLLKEEEAWCPRKNTLLITAEPPSIKTYHSRYIRQFGRVITSHRNMKHPSIIHAQQGLNWMVGGNFIKESSSWEVKHSKDYDELQNINTFKKEKLLSVVASSKRITEGHDLRFKFLSRLKEHFKDKIDIFGIGFQEIPDKWDAIYPYKYHIAIENSVLKDYWSEKISDAYLAGAYPFYYGCPNIYEYFERDSLTQIDITNPKQAITNIEKCIEGECYERHINDVQIARDRILNRYNIFAVIQRYCGKYANNKSKKIPLKLKPEFDVSKSPRIEALKKLRSQILPAFN